MPAPMKGKPDKGAGHTTATTIQVHLKKHSLHHNQAMKASTITKAGHAEPFQYRINGQRVSRHRYTDEINRRKAQRQGCQTFTTSNVTASGNIQVTTFFSI